MRMTSKFHSFSNPHKRVYTASAPCRLDIRPADTRSSDLEIGGRRGIRPWWPGTEGAKVANKRLHDTLQARPNNFCSSACMCPSWLPPCEFSVACTTDHVTWDQGMVFLASALPRWCAAETAQLWERTFSPLSTSTTTPRRPESLWYRLKKSWALTLTTPHFYDSTYIESFLYSTCCGPPLLFR
jgi:hypothetical protein